MDINFIFLAKTSNQKQYEMTCTAFDSLVRSQKYGDNFNIILMESQSNAVEKYQNRVDRVIDVGSITPFNYNAVINKGLTHIKDYYEWICVCNNDLIFDENWLQSIKISLQEHSDVKSICPRYSKTQKEDEFGYTCPGHVLGWCFMFHKDVLNKIKKFDEIFDFYFQDNDYAEQLKKYNFKHMSVANSIVVHLGQQTTGLENINKLINDAHKFIEKYGMGAYLINEQNKQKLK